MPQAGLILSSWVCVSGLKQKASHSGLGLLYVQLCACLGAQLPGNWIPALLISGRVSVGYPSLLSDSLYSSWILCLSFYQMCLLAVPPNLAGPSRDPVVSLKFACWWPPTSHDILYSSASLLCCYTPNPCQHLFINSSFLYLALCSHQCGILHQAFPFVLFVRCHNLAYHQSILVNLFEKSLVFVCL